MLLGDCRCFWAIEIRGFFPISDNGLTHIRQMFDLCRRLMHFSIGQLEILSEWKPILQSETMQAARSEDNDLRPGWWLQTVCLWCPGCHRKQLDAGKQRGKCDDQQTGQIKTCCGAPSSSKTFTVLTGNHEYSRIINLHLYLTVLNQGTHIPEAEIGNWLKIFLEINQVVNDQIIVSADARHKGYRKISAGVEENTELT